MASAGTAAPKVTPEYLILLPQIHATLRPIAEQDYVAKQAFEDLEHRFNDPALEEQFFQYCFTLIKHLFNSKRDVQILLDKHFPDTVLPYALFNLTREEWDAKRLREFLKIRIHFLRESEFLAPFGMISFMNELRRMYDSKFVDHLERYQQKLVREHKQISSHIQQLAVPASQLFHITVGNKVTRCFVRDGDEPITAQELGIIRKSMVDGLDNGSLTHQKCLDLLNELRALNLLSELAEGCFIGLAKECG